MSEMAKHKKRQTDNQTNKTQHSQQLVHSQIEVEMLFALGGVGILLSTIPSKQNQRISNSKWQQ